MLDHLTAYDCMTQQFHIKQLLGLVCFMVTVSVYWCSDLSVVCLFVGQSEKLPRSFSKILEEFIPVAKNSVGGGGSRVEKFTLSWDQEKCIM
jgi:hypothetical protein